MISKAYETCVLGLGTGFLLAIALGVAGCGSDGEKGADGIPMDAGVNADAGGLPDGGDSEDTVGPPASAYVTPPDTLAGWNLFTDAVTQAPGARTIPYAVIAPLFSDYTAKRRFIYVPEGKTIAYSEKDVWSLPEGSVLVKTFSYLNDVRDPAAGERLLETRLQVFTAQGVVPHTYVWNAEQTEAIRKVAGTTIDATWIDAEGVEVHNKFTVPNTNQCFDCHGKREVANALAVRTRQMDRDHAYDGVQQNQIDHLNAIGFLDRAPEGPDLRERLVDPYSDAPLDLRARSYIDANCSQCHKPGGDASASAMWLDWPHTGPDQLPVTWGVCKRPTSAGGATCERSVDILPGHPEGSIYLCRMESTEPKIQMPPLGRNMVDAQGVALVSEWIRSLQGNCE